MKKLLCLIIIVLFMATLAFPSSAAGISPNHWAINYADFVTNFGIIAGTRSTFNPDGEFTREKMTLALAKCNSLSFSPGHATTPFSDVPYSHEYSKSVKWASDLDIVRGYSDGTFRPSQSILRKDFCVMLYRYCNALSVNPPFINSPVTFTDDSSIPNYAKTAVSTMQQAGIMGGYSDGSFKPNVAITRAEAACAITKLYGAHHNPDSSINIWVKQSDGAPIHNARAFAYKNTTSYNDLYPSVSNISVSHGFCTTSGLTSSYDYGINVIAEDYGSVPVPSLKSPSRFFVFVTLPTRNSNSTHITSPIVGFTAISMWPHYGASCDSACRNNFTRICPQGYFNVTVMQNFGWRYNYNTTTHLNFLDFHQAIDMSYPTGTVVINCFNQPALVESAGFFPGCGNMVQLYDTSYTLLYATYMHLNSYNVVENSYVPSLNAIATVGSTGTSAAHLHFSLAKSNIESVSGNNSTEIKQFVDHMIYFN